MTASLSGALAWTRLGCLGVTTAAVALLGDVEVARACSWPACSVPLRLPGIEFIPGNLVRFEVTADNPGAMSLRTEAGEPIPASLRTIGGDLVFAPEAPIAPFTTVVLDYEQACYPGYGGEPAPPGQFTFQTLEHAQITLQPGSLYVGEYGVASPGDESSERGFVRVRMVPVADYAAHHLMTHTLTVDGQSGGSWPRAGADVQFDIGSYCHSDYDGFQYNSCGGLDAVPEGRHTLSLQTKILGYEGEIAPLTLEIETRCPGAGGLFDPETSSTPPESSGEEPAAGAEGSAVTQTGDADPSVENGVPAASDADAFDDVRRADACALRGGSTPSSAAGGALLMLGLAGWYRRRSRRDSRGS